MARTASPGTNRAAARLGTLAIIALLAIGGLTLLFSTWRTIDPGYVGIVFDKASHKVTNTLDPGWVFINPLTESITRYPVGVQTLVMVQAAQEGAVGGDDSVKVGTREGQTMFADVSVQYSVDKGNAAQLYQTWAGAPIEKIEDNLVRQVTRSVLNDVASSYGWEKFWRKARRVYAEGIG